MGTYRRVSEETTSAPRYEQKAWKDRKGNDRTHSSKAPAGGAVDQTFWLWRCDQCRAPACTAEGRDLTGIACAKCSGPKTDPVPQGRRRR